jgi:hypothetical protein
MKIGKYRKSGGAHVGVIGPDGLGRDDLAAQFGKASRKYAHQTLGVGAAVVDGGDAARTLRVGELGADGALEVIVVGRAQIAGLVRAFGRQVGGGVGSRDHDHAGLGDDRRGHAGLAGAGRANDGHDGVVGHELLRGGLAAFGVAASVLTGQLDGVAQYRVALIGHGDFHAAARVDAQGGVTTRDDHGPGDVDRITGRDVHAADGVGTGVGGCARLAGGEQEASADQQRHQRCKFLRHFFSSKGIQPN